VPVLPCDGGALLFLQAWKVTKTIAALVIIDK
jgi:hypothetical protein